MSLSFLSVCSGIEAASVAWHPLGMRAAAFAEIESFPSAVLAYRYPGVPNVGDMRGINGEDYYGRINILVGGTPCQSFSVAGLRRGLQDERGNLALEFVRIANESCPDFIVWENVPGVLSDRGNAFGCFLGGLAGEETPLVPAGKKWTDSGYVLGPERTVCWRILDAQYFGLAQRRRRVFVVACPRGRFDPRKVLLEFDGVRRDFAPSREAGQEIAGTFTSRARSGSWNNSAEHAAAGYIRTVTQSLTARLGAGGPDDNKAQGGFYVADLAPTLRAGGNSTGGNRPVGTDVDTCESLVCIPPLCYGGGNTSGSINVSPALNAHAGASRRQDFDTEAFVVANALRGEGFDASEDGTGRQNLVITPINTQLAMRHGALGERTGLGVGDPGDPAFTLQAGHHHAVHVGRSEETLTHAVRLAQTSSNGWGVQEDLSYTLDGANGKAVHTFRENSAQERMKQRPRAASFSPLAFTERGRKEGRTLEAQPDLAYALTNPGSGGRTHSRQILDSSCAVRRLTPRECERLQGFPDDYTLIPYKRPFADLPAAILERSYRRYLRRMHKQRRFALPLDELIKCADGPRYKALGNSMAVPCMHWIGERILMEYRREQP